MSNMSENEEQIEIIRQHVIQTIAENMDLFGITPSIGRLYGTLYFQDEAMTLDEMCKELQMSKASMSTGVRVLQDSHMVHKTWEKGVRKDLYVAETDWYQIFIKRFTTKWRKAVELNLKVVEEANKQMNTQYEQTSDDHLKQQIAIDLRKLDHAHEYYTWLSRLVESFETEEIYTLIPRQRE